MRKIVAAGMPASGKSSFIGALTYVFNSNEIETALTLTKLSDDEGHLSSLEHAWVSVTEIERTKSKSERWSTFHTRSRSTGAKIDLLVPDLRGELFEQPATIGRCQQELWESLLECDGLMLFTNANIATDDAMVDGINHVLKAVLDGQEEPVQKEASKGLTPFRPSDMPEEAKLVELLQAMLRFPIDKKVRRLAVIVSAWDVVQSAGTSPSDWLASDRPMLSQYVESNSAWWDARIYGVSALGGELPKDAAALRAYARPSERITLVGHDAAAHDLTEIVKWLAVGKEV